MKTLVFILALLAQQHQQMTRPTPEEIAAARAAAMPGPEHTELAALAGTWDIEMTFTMGPGLNMTMSGRGTNRMILGDRFLISEASGKDPKSGYAVETFSIYGFDRRSNDFTIMQYDSTGTYGVGAIGKRAAGANEVSMRGEMSEHGGIKKYDMVLRWIDRDTYVVEVFFHLPEGRSKIVDVMHKRIK